MAVYYIHWGLIFPHFLRKHNRWGQAAWIYSGSAPRPTPEHSRPKGNRIGPPPRKDIMMKQKSFEPTGKPLAGYLLGGLLAGLLFFGGGSFSGTPAHAGELDPVQNSVISTDLFLSWIGNQQKTLGLTPDQTRELRDIRVDFKLKSQDLGREMGRIAGSLSQEVGTYPIPLDKVKPSIRRLSDLRGELTLSAISSLARVQGILNKSQWEKARTSWSTHLATARSKAPSKPSNTPDKK